MRDYVKAMWLILQQDITQGLRYSYRQHNFSPRVH